MAGVLAAEGLAFAARLPASGGAKLGTWKGTKSMGVAAPNVAVAGAVWLLTGCSSCSATLAATPPPLREQRHCCCSGAAGCGYGAARTVDATLRPAAARELQLAQCCWSPRRGLHTAHGYTPTRLYPTNTGPEAKATVGLIAAKGSKQPPTNAVPRGAEHALRQGKEHAVSTWGA